MILELYNGQDLWLGITDEAEEGIFIGTDGSKINWYNWGTNEPDNRNGAGGFSGGKVYSKLILNDPYHMDRMIYK